MDVDDEFGVFSVDHMARFSELAIAFAVEQAGWDNKWRWLVRWFCGRFFFFFSFFQGFTENLTACEWYPLSFESDFISWSFTYCSSYTTSLLYASDSELITRIIPIEHRVLKNENQVIGETAKNCPGRLKVNLVCIIDKIGKAANFACRVCIQDGVSTHEVLFW